MLSVATLDQWDVIFKLYRSVPVEHLLKLSVNLIIIQTYI